MSPRRATTAHPQQGDVASLSPPAVRPLSCPLQPAISPHADEAQRLLGEWLQARGPAWDDERRRRFTRIGFARYAARLYPDADLATLLAVSALFAWFFLLDDTADSATTPDIARLRRMLADCLAVLRRSPARSRAAASQGLPGLLAQTWQVPAATMPRSWRERFADAVEHHLDGVLAEARAKALGVRPGVEAYVRLRRATSAAYVAHVLTEFATRAPLPGSVHGHPAVQAYSTAGNDLLSWFNDLLSLGRDEATSGGHNLVLALAAEHRVSTAEAVELAVAKWQALMDSYAGLRAAVPSFGRELDASVEHYLTGVDRSVRGTIDWSLESIRYQPPPLIAPYLTMTPT
ncbi:MAG TPA: terpene synthase [Actinoplanes sp.]|nr:terpene synthase [Actinoplanes sp.]